MTEEIKKQIQAVRATGRANMLDINSVQRIAYELEFYELVNYMSEHRFEYFQSVITGSTNTKTD